MTEPVVPSVPAPVPASAPAPSSAPALQSNLKTNLIRLGVLIAVIAISVAVFLLRNEVEMLRRFGYPGIFVVNLLGSATIVLPAPGLAIVFAMSALKSQAGELVFNPFWIGIAAGFGAALGEMSGYAAGFSGQAIIENSKWYDRIHNFTERYGLITIVVLAILPFPLFDFAGIAAGSLKMSLPKFFIATLIGKLIKMWIVAYAGATGADWATLFIRRRPVTP
jgi:membrane protein DedA with SNARE-associated domain